ncbi:MAG: hypothetical protein Q9217_000871 [Psora testacea]
MSDTTNVIATEEALSTSSILVSSLGSISSSRRSHSEISKAYRRASNFFVTRRFLEALSSIKPLVTITHHDGQATGYSDGAERAPIAKVDRKWRVKVWSLYLTLLNAIADLGQEEGQAVFGKQVWKALVSKVEDGTIWEEVENIGYSGIEGCVDAEVVVNLANLLLAQSPNQKANQQYLETYLSAAGHPEMGLNSRFKSQTNLNGHARSPRDHVYGTDTLRDLETQMQIIEMYVLHVLPRNGEWAYAKDFISMSELLDEERKDAYLQILNELQEDEIVAQDGYEDAVPQQEEAAVKMPPLRDITRTDSNVTIKPYQPSIRRQLSSENDYGIEDTQSAPRPTSLKPMPPKPAPESAPLPVRKPSGSLQSCSSRLPPNKSSKGVSHSNVLSRSMAVLAPLQRLLSNMTLHMSQNPMLLLRFILFFMGLILASSRRNIRDRLGRLTAAGWDKVRKTVGMGVKVSYI